jgi:outer membrane protein
MPHEGLSGGKMRIPGTFFLVLALTAFLSTAAIAADEQAPAAAPAPAPAPSSVTKIGYVDLQRALNESTAGKEAKAELEAVVKKMQEEIDKKMAEREKLKTELEKQSLALSAEARRQKADHLEKLQKEIERMISDSNAEMQKRQRDKEVAIIKDLKVVIDDIGKTDGYTIILPAEAILYSSEGTDLTGTVIERYNAMHEAAGEQKPEPKPEPKPDQKPEKKKPAPKK